jgi:hypothetical protein
LERKITKYLDERHGFSALFGGKGEKREMEIWNVKSGTRIAGKGYWSFYRTN